MFISRSLNDIMAMAAVVVAVAVGEVVSHRPGVDDGEVANSANFEINRKTGEENVVFSFGGWR